MTDKPKPAQKFITPFEDAWKQEEERIAARQKELEKQYGEETAGSDKALSSQSRHDYSSDSASKKKNFDQKIYMFPESYNALRRELVDYWPVFFTTINPDTGTSLAHDMVYDAPQFVGTMNGALDMTVQFDSDNVDGICKTFLNKLRNLRGISSLN